MTHTTLKKDTKKLSLYTILIPLEILRYLTDMKQFSFE